MKKRLLYIFLTAVFLTNTISYKVNALAGQWSANGTNVYYSDGNVGIGTSNPGWKFQMDVPGSSSSFLLNGNGTGTTNRMFQISNGSNKVMTFLANGSLGLGTIAPTSQFGSVYDAGVDAQIASYNSAYFYFNGDGSTAVSGNYRYKTLAITNNYRSSDNSGEGVNVGLEVYAGNGDKNFAALFTGGNVGIGTENPSKLLTVNGTILAREILVSNSSTNWPDYVFNNDYNLMSLKDLEEYIKENKHLPNIPDAKEIEENGISIGEMQKLQMQKIEELSLHLIEQQKEIDELKAEIKQLKN